MSDPKSVLHRLELEAQQRRKDKTARKAAEKAEKKRLEDLARAQEAGPAVVFEKPHVQLPLKSLQNGIDKPTKGTTKKKEKSDDLQNSTQALSKEARKQEKKERKELKEKRRQEKEAKASKKGQTNGHSASAHGQHEDQDDDDDEPPPPPPRTLDSIEGRLKQHARAFDGLLSLIPAKFYYNEDKTVSL